MAEQSGSEERRGNEGFPRWLLWPALGTVAASLLFLSASLVLTRRASHRGKSPLPASAEQAPGEARAPERGDINNDGAIDILDVLKLTQIIRDTGDEPAWGDINGDGRVNLIDVDVLARQVVTL